MGKKTSYEELERRVLELEQALRGGRCDTQAPSPLEREQRGGIRAHPEDPEMNQSTGGSHLRQRYEQAFKALATNNVRPLGKVFFRETARRLSEILEADCTFIATLVNDDTLRTISFWRDGKPADNFSYQIADTPCRNVVGKEVWSYVSGVASAFPKDLALTQIGAEGYVGVPLFDSRDAPIGLIAAITRTPLPDTAFAEDILQLFATRTATEMERTRTEEALRKSERRYRELVEGTDDLITRVDAAGKFLYVNHVAERIFGVRPERCVGRSAFDFIHPEDREKTQAEFCRWLEEKRSSATHENRQVNENSGKVHHMLWTVNLKTDPGGALAGVDGIARDMTERKRSEDRIRELNRTLERRVAERTERLMKTGEALRESTDRIRETRKELMLSTRMATLGKVVASASHEINTPLSIGVTTASYLADKTKTIEARYRSGKMARSDFERYLSKVDESARLISANLSRSAELIRSLKAVAVDQCTDEKRRFQLKTYLGEILTTLGPSLRKTSHTVRVNCPEGLELDSHPGALSQIVTNLVMNSLKHGFENMERGEIKIDVCQEKERVSIRYSDNGRGMTQEIQDRIFDEYFTTKRMEGGSGLGTHIIFNLVKQRLNGDIECRSTLGRGTTFIITLPTLPTGHARPLADSINPKNPDNPGDPI